VAVLLLLEKQMSADTSNRAAGIDKTPPFALFAVLPGLIALVAAISAVGILIREAREKPPSRRGTEARTVGLRDQVRRQIATDAANVERQRSYAEESEIDGLRSSAHYSWSRLGVSTTKEQWRVSSTGRGAETRVDGHHLRYSEIPSSHPDGGYEEFYSIDGKTFREKTELAALLGLG